MLGMSVQQNQRDWDDRLPYVMAAYRASGHESTKFTANMLVFGRENRAPADLVLSSVQGESEQYDSIDYYVFELQSKLREAHQLARSHLRTTAERRKETYDTKVKCAIFDVGQWVWYLVPRKFVGRYPKWTRNYQGSGREGRFACGLLDPATSESGTNRGARRQAEALLRGHSGIVAHGSSWSGTIWRSTC